MAESEEGEGLLAIGGKFGAYDVLRLLGRGGMGEVYLLRSTKTGEFFACKIMYPQKSGASEREAQEWRRRFANEAMFAMKVTHRNLIRVYEAGEDPETHFCYIIMDYMSGGSLTAKIRAKGRLDVSEAVKIAAKVATALEVAHRAGMVHRDIKPDNILFDDDGEPRLADLGIAKFSSGESATTATNIIIGTPSYMAPEQMVDSHRVDARADVYSLGIVLHEMLTGSCPHEDSGTIERMARALNGEEIKNVCEVRNDVPAGIGYVLERMTANNAQRRPGSALEAAQMLCDALSGKMKSPRRFGKRFAAALEFLKVRGIASFAWPIIVALIASLALFVFTWRHVGSGGKAVREQPQPTVQTNKVNMTRYNVIVLTNEVGEVIAPVDAPAESATDEPFAEIVVQSESGKRDAAMAAPAGGGGGKQAARPQDSAQADVEDGGISLKVVVDEGKRSPGGANAKTSPSEVRYAPGTVYADLEPLPDVAGDAAAAASPVPDASGGRAAGDAAKPQPMRTRYAVQIQEVKISSVPKEFKDDIIRRQHEHDSRYEEWGGKGCIVFGKLEIEDMDGVDGVATWAWLKRDGTFTATMHPNTSNGEIVFLRHGFERIVVNVPVAFDSWKRGVAYNLGTLKMRRLRPEDEGRISFNVRLPTDVSRASVRVELFGNYPLGYNRTERPLMKRTIVSKTMSSGGRLDVPGCVRDRYVVTIDAPGCQLFSRGYVLGDDAARQRGDTLASDGNAEIGEIALQRSRNARLSIRGLQNGRWLKKDAVVDNRTSFDMYGGASVRLASVHGERNSIRILYDAVGEELYDYGRIEPRHFQKCESDHNLPHATKMEDPIVRPGHVYRYDSPKFPEGHVVFYLENY